MKTRLLFYDKVVENNRSIVEIKIWAVSPSPDKAHGYKYSLVYIKDQERLVGYDNGEGKGDHRHYLDCEEPYEFRGIDKLFEDFYKDVQRYKDHEN